MSLDRRYARLSALLLVTLGLFSLFAAKAVAGGAFGWDRFLFSRLYSGESDWTGGRTPGQDNEALHAVLPLLYRLADARKLVLLIVAVFAVLLVLKLVKAAAFFALAVAVTALAPVLKDVFGRPSPFPMPADPSFPSGHALGSMAIAAGVVALLPPSRWRQAAVGVGAIFVVCVGLAVIADGGHWPSDVLAAWCLAVAWIAALRSLVGDPLGRERSRPGPQAAIAPPVAPRARATSAR